MKKLLLCFTLICGNSLLSQTNFDKEAIEPIGNSKFTIGSKGGYGHAFLFPYKNCIYQSSWNVGLSMVCAFGEHVGINIDGVFSSEGARFRSVDIRSRLKLEYLRVPLRAVLFLRKYENDFRPKFGAGPCIGFLQNSEEQPLVNKIDWGGSVTVGFHYRLLRGFWLTGDLNYYQGFYDVIKSNQEKDCNGNLRVEIGLMVGF